MRSKEIQISKDGPTFSRIIAGVWKWGKWGWDLETDQIQDLIEHSISEGVTTFDHADIYGEYEGEKEFGDVLKANPSLRDEIQIITKCGIKLKSESRPDHKVKSYDTSGQHIRASVENSLTQLGTDYIDLLLIHRPDPLMDPDEVARTFEDLRTEGKVHHFGVSNFNRDQFDLLHSRIPLVTNQVEASIMSLSPFEDGTFDQCLKYGFSPMAWSPLTGGRVFHKTADPAVQRIRAAADEIAKRHGDWLLDQVLLAWLTEHPASILPVLGTGRKERITASIQSLELNLSREEWFELWEASTGYEVP